MKILIQNETNLVKYCEKNIIQFANNTLVVDDNNAITIIISDLNSTNSTMETINKDIIPTDFVGDKYKFIDGEFVLNEDFIEQIEEEIEE